MVTDRLIATVPDFLAAQILLNAAVLTKYSDFDPRNPFQLLRPDR